VSNEFDAKEHELVPGVLRGYRQWRVAPDGLLACNFPVRWDRGINTAIHFGGGYVYSDGTTSTHRGAGNFFRDRFPDEREAPVKGCTCGFYALHDPRDISTGPAGWVGGSIKAYGRVILGDLGFKAQYAEIESLTSYWGPSDLTDQLRAWYPGVPVFDTAPELAEAFPPIPVTELLPPKPKIVSTMEMVWQLTPVQQAQLETAFKNLYRSMNVWPPSPPNIEEESNDT